MKLRIDGFTWSRVVNFKTNLLSRKKRKKRQGFVYEKLHFGLENCPTKPLD